MKKYIIGFLFMFIGTTLLVAQEESTAQENDLPVRTPFESGILIDQQTSQIPTAKTLEMLIQHRFGTFENGIEDVYGIYSSANIRLGLNYTILNNLMVGYGLTRTNMYSDFQIKYNLLQQTRKNTIPVSVTLYGDMAIDGRKDAVFGTEYQFTNRISYFGQVIVGRKFNDAISLQAHGSFTHFNSVDSISNHDVIGVGFNGRIKFSPQSSFIFQFDAPLKIQAISEQKEFEVAEPNIGIGYEVSTSTHAFQIFISNTNGILSQHTYMYNQADWKSIENWRLGFVMTRLWGF